MSDVLYAASSYASAAAARRRKCPVGMLDQQALQPGRYPIRLRIRREDVFPYDLGYSRSVIVRVG